MDNNIEDKDQQFIRDENKRSYTKLYIFLSLFFIISILFIYVIIFASDNKTNTISTKITSSFNHNKEATPVPTSFPFQEMTIPYLRSQTYNSKITDIEEVSDNGTYTSNTASYESDGLRLNGLLMVPDGDMPEGGFPAIVFVHGYIPPSLYKTLENYTSYADYFARRGYVVYKIDLRGHAESDGDASGAYYSGDYIVDTLNAYSALENFDKVNKNRVGLWGHSMAGNVTFRSAVVKRDIPAVVIWGGAVYTYDDWQKYGINDNSYRPPSDTSDRQRKRDQLISQYGSFSEKSEFWKQVVPTNYLDGVKTKFQFNHAVDDDVVNVGYSRDVVKILEEDGFDVQLNEYPSGGHNIAGSSFSDAMNNSVSFFDKNL